LSSLTVAQADSKKTDSTIDKNLAMIVSSCICIRQQEASDMPVTTNRKDCEKLAFTGWRLVELLPTKTDLSADDTKLSQVRAAVGGYPLSDTFFASEIYQGAS
jgi:hypothetical protein